MKTELLLDNFELAISRLDQALATPAASDLIRAGCIQYFEFCFELAWKSVKRLAEQAGQLDCLSPKAALKTAFANRWIDNEETWLDMLASRNLMSHTYSAADALTIYQRLPAYLPEFKVLMEALHRA